VTGHNPPPRLGQNPLFSDKAGYNPQNHTSPTWKLNSRTGGHRLLRLVQKPPDKGGSEPGGLCPGVYVHQSWNLAFRTPLSCNRKRHRTLCSNSTGGYVLWVSSGLATDRGFWSGGLCPGGLCPPIYIDTHTQQVIMIQHQSTHREHDLRRTN